MKRKFLLSGILIVGLMFISSTTCQVFGQTTQGSTVKQTTTNKYTCPMHPEVVQDQPGKCPQCGMALVVKGDKQKRMVDGDSSKMHKEHKKNWKDSTKMDKEHKMRDTTKNMNDMK